MNRNRLWLIAALPLGVAACGGGGPSRTEVVTPIVSVEVPARFAEFATTANSLSGDVTGWCDGGGEAPIAQIENARTEWAATKPFWAGPVMERRAQYRIDTRIDAEDIDALLASDDAVDAASLGDVVGADQPGLGALRYLAEGEPDERRCDYARGIAELVAREATALSDDWTTYGDDLVTDDDAANDVLRDLVSNAVFALRAIETEEDPAVAAGLLSGAQWAVLGAPDTDYSAISTLLDDKTVEQLKQEFGAADAMAAELALSTNVVGELGLTLNFSDADGDGG